MCVGCWAGVTYLRYTVLASPKKGETAVHCCDPTLSVFVMLVSRNVFHVVSALQSIVCLQFLAAVRETSPCSSLEPFSGRNKDQTRESGGNSAYIRGRLLDYLGCVGTSDNRRII